MDGGSGGEIYIIIVLGWTVVVGERYMLLYFQDGRGSGGEIYVIIVSGWTGVVGERYMLL